MGYLGGYGSGNGKFISPLSVAFDKNGFAYVADVDSSRISVWSTPTLPSAPQNITVKPLAATSLKASWAAPARIGSSPLTGYRVLFRAVGTTTWMTAATVDASTLSYTLSNLEPNTEYDVQVVAVNAIGDSANGDYTSLPAIQAKTPTADALASTGSSVFIMAGAAGTLLIVGMLAVMKIWRKG